MHALADLLSHPWWHYPKKPSGFDELYHGFNVLEGWVWCAFGALVLMRMTRPSEASSAGKRGWELAYAAAFVAFGLTDFVEAYQLTFWLLAAKGANVALLLWLRRNVIRRYYPKAKVF